MEEIIINEEVEKRKDLLIWVDLETTGLDLDDSMRGVHKHKILEIGIHITDSYYNIIDDGLEIIVHHDKEVIEPLMIEYVKNMHESNGLLEKVEKSTISLQEAEKMIVDYINSYNIEPGSSPICGNNVGFDKNFIDAQLPQFSKFLHYRKIDVSSLKEIVRRQYPEVLELVKKEANHRALDDIKESIKELITYQENVFIPITLALEKKLKL